MTLTDIIQARAGAEPVRLALILGSGLGHLAHAVEGVAIPYADLPGFPHVSVSGHNPSLHVGIWKGSGLPCWARGSIITKRAILLRCVWRWRQ
jgi:purine-nucleoside phosphorylase